MSDPIELRQYVRTIDMHEAVLPFDGTEQAELWQGDAVTGQMVRVPYNLLQGDPIAHKLTHELNGTDQLGSNNPAPNTHVISSGTGKVDGWVSDGSETVKGKVQFATDGESVAAKAVQANDGRLSDARPPETHGSTHNIGGIDAITDLPTAGQKEAMAGSFGTPSLSNPFVTDLDPRMAAASPVITASVTYTVGTGGDFATINAAIENVSLKFPQYKLSGVRVTLQLLTGFVMEEQIIVDGKDLSWITITAVDASVTVDPAYITVGVGGTPAVFGAINHAALPIIAAIFAFASYQSGIIGISALHCSSVIVESGGFNYASVGLNCNYASRARVYDGEFIYCGRGIMAQFSSHIGIWLTDVSNYVTSGIYATYASMISAPNLVCTTTGGEGVVSVNAGSIIMAASFMDTSSQQHNILTGYGAILNQTRNSIACRARASVDGSTAANVSGTYAITGTTCTVTLAAHGHIVGHKVYLDFTSGSGVDGLYTITGVTANTFTVSHASATTSGNVTLNRRIIVGSANVHSVTFISTGLFWVNFIVPMTDALYSAILTCENEGVGPFVQTNNTTYPKTVYGVSIKGINVSGAVYNCKLIDIAVFD
jgi:hypothetical protein